MTKDKTKRHSWSGLSKRERETRIKKLRKNPTLFKKGINSWDFLTEDEKKTRKDNLSKRMSRYNPMKNPDAQKLKSKSEKKRRGETGRLTHMEKRRILKERGKCEKCGIVYPLTVHHKDGNRYNNNKGNLMVICFNCHYDIEWGDSKYGQKRRDYLSGKL